MRQTGATMNTNTIESFLDDLTAELDRAIGADGTLRLTDVDKRGEGNSWETYLVTVTWDGPGDPQAVTYAVKRQPVSGIVGDYDVAREVALLDAADAIGMRVPKVVASVVPTGDARATAPARASFVRVEKGYTVYSVPSGRFTFTAA